MQTHELYQAAKLGYSRTVTTILAAPAGRASIDTRKRDRKTPLLVAVKRGHYTSARLLLEAGASSGLAHAGRSATHIAIAHNRTDILQLLLQHAPHLAAARDNNGWTPLHYACYYGQHSSLVMLITALRDTSRFAETLDASSTSSANLSFGPTIPTSSTALHVAITRANYECARLLVHAGARCSLLDSQGRSLAHLVAEYGGPAMVELLAWTSAAFTGNTLSGVTPLMIAATRRDYAMVLAILNLLAQRMDKHALEKYVLAQTTSSSTILGTSYVRGVSALHLSGESVAVTRELLSRVLPGTSLEFRADGGTGATPASTTRGESAKAEIQALFAAKSAAPAASAAKRPAEWPADDDAAVAKFAKAFMSAVREASQ